MPGGNKYSPPTYRRTNGLLYLRTSKVLLLAAHTLIICMSSLSPVRLRAPSRAGRASLMRSERGTAATLDFFELELELEIQVRVPLVA